MNIYDFDETIYDGDSSVDFIKYCFKVNKKCLLMLPKFLIIVCLYLIKVVEKEKMKSVFFSVIKYFDDIEKVVLSFWQEKNYKLKDYYMKQRKKTDIIISASPEFLLAPVAKKYGFKLIGTKVDLSNGKLVGKNCHGEEKVKRLKKEEGITKCDKFYSDSLSDTPLALIAKQAFLVKKEELIKWEDYKESKFKKLKKMFFHRDFITFLFIGVINAFNGIWIAYVISLFLKNAILAYILGFCISLCIAYILNSKLNFKVKLSLINLAKFAINNIPNFIIQVASVVILLNKLQLGKLVSYSISAVIAVPITFILVKINVFRKKGDTN